MANLDTRLKRESGVHVGMPWRTGMSPPDGAIGQADRQVASHLYSGILASASSYPASLNDLTTEFHAYLIDLHNATPGQHDSNPLVRDDVATMLAGTDVVLDRNTQYAQYLT